MGPGLAQLRCKDIFARCLQRRFSTSCLSSFTENSSGHLASFHRSIIAGNIPNVYPNPYAPQNLSALGVLKYTLGVCCYLGCFSKR